MNNCACVCVREWVCVCVRVRVRVCPCIPKSMYKNNEAEQKFVVHIAYLQIALTVALVVMVAWMFKRAKSKKE